MITHTSLMRDAQYKAVSGVCSAGLTMITFPIYYMNTRSCEIKNNIQTYHRPELVQVSTS